MDESPPNSLSNPLFEDDDENSSPPRELTTQPLGGLIARAEDNMSRSSTPYQAATSYDNNEDFFESPRAVVQPFTVCTQGF